MTDYVGGSYPCVAISADLTKDEVTALKCMDSGEQSDARVVTPTVVSTLQLRVVQQRQLLRERTNLHDALARLGSNTDPPVSDTV